MASTIGGWYLSGNGSSKSPFVLQYRLLVDGKVTDTVLASFTGLSNLTGDKTNVKVKVGDEEKELDDCIVVENSTEDDSTNYNLTFTLKDDVLGKTVTLTAAKGTTQTLTIDENAEQNLRKIAEKDGSSSEHLSYYSDKKGNNFISVVADLTKGYTLSSSTNKRSGQKFYTYTWYEEAIKDQPLAIISGVRKFDLTNNETDDDAKTAKAAKIKAYEDSAVITDNALDETEGFEKTGVITLSKVNAGTEENPNYTEEGSVLGTTAISIAPTAIATANGISYTLALDESKAGTYGYAQNLNLEGYKNDAYWSYSGTTASYKIDSPIGYETTNAKNKIVRNDKVYASSAIDAAEVADDDTKITKIKVTAAKSTTLVTVTGLAKDLDISEDKKSIGVTKYENENQEVTSDLSADLTVTIKDGEYPVYGFNAKGQSIITTKGDLTVNINKNVLNNTTVALSSSVATGKFNVATENILTAESTATAAPEELNIWVINGSTATYKRVQRAYYQKKAEDTKLTYVAQKDVTTYLTISGLKAEALDEAVKTATTTANISEGSDGYEPVLITAIEGLAIDKSAEDLAKLYKKNNRGQRLTITTEIPGTITIDPKFLDNRNASITASDNFKIVLSENKAPTFKDEEWNLSGTKAVLKGDINAGWIVTQNGKTVTYTKSGENQTLATITGLKTGTKLVVEGNERKIGFGNDTSFKQGITINNESLSSNNPVDFSTAAGASNPDYNRIGITVSKNVLNGNAAITSNFFDLDLDATDTAGGSVPTNSIPGNYWTLGTTATYKNNFGPYYELANNQLSITYKNPANNTNKPTVLTTIKGLDANVTEDDLTVTGDVVKVNPNALDQKNVTITNPTGGTSYKLALDTSEAPTLNKPEWVQSTVNGAVTYVANVSGGYKTNSTSSAIVYTPTGEDTTLFSITGLRSGLGSLDGGGFSGISLSKADNTVKLSYSALNNANVALKSSYGYDLVIDADVPTSSTGGKSAWVVSGTDAILKEITTPAYYVYDEAKDTLTYKPAVVQKSGRTETTYARISGLKKGLMMNREGTAIGYYDEDGAFVEGITFDNKDIIIKNKGVLSTTDVKLDKVAIDGKYSISFAENLASEIMPQFNSENNPTWTVKNKTAYLIGGVNDGYVLSEDLHSIKYYKGNETAATIATIANLPASVTTAIANGASGLRADDHEIKVGEGVLGNTKLSLTTKIPIDQQNYIFTLGDGVQDYKQALENAKKIWTIDTRTSTATYRGSIDSAYYALDGTSTAISYTAAGLPDNLKFAEIKGLTNLVTIAGGALKGVEIKDGETNNYKLFELSSGVLKAGTSVQLKGWNENDDFNFGLSIADDVATPENTACFVADTNAITLYNGKTAGYVLDGDLSNLSYSAVTPSKETPLVKITGLSATFKSSGNTVKSGEAYEAIDGISVNDDKVITLSHNVLTYSGKVGFDSGGSNGYTFALANDVKKYSEGPGWKANTYDGFDLYENISNGGYELTSSGTEINLKSGGGITGNPIGSISGIKATVGDDHQIAGISFDTVNNTITLSKSVLTGKDVTLNLTNGGSYSLALIQDNDDDAGYVAKPDKTNIWTFNDGTATYEQKTTEGYEVGDDGKTISYVKASTITTKINNLNKDNVIGVSEEDKNGNKLIYTGDTGDNSGSTGTEVTEAITFDSANGKFTINYENVLAHKTSSITTSVTKGATNPGYTLGLANGIAADTLDPVWSKTNKETTATLKQTTKAGYSLQTDGKKVIYSSDPTVKTLATVTNLKKDVALNESGTIDTDGDPTTLATETTAGLSYVLPTDPADTSKPGTITIAKGVLDTGTVKLGTSDNYEFALATGNDSVPASAKEQQPAWSTTPETKNRVTTTTATYQTVKSPYYSFGTKTVNRESVEDKKQIVYNKATDATLAFTVTGLKGGVKANADGSLDGISLDGKTITFTGDVLGTSNVTITPNDSNSYTPVIGTGAFNYDTGKTSWEAQQEWINSGTTYTYKTYDKASYEIDGSTIKYHAPTAGTTHAIVKGLKSGLTFGSGVFTATEKDSSVVGGTLKLSANELNKTNVTLTNSGDFKLALALDETNATLAATTTVGSWTTSGTKATLNGKVGVGYILSENANAITYNKAKTTKTLATVTGIVSGATIDSVESGVIYLGKDQLGTSNVVVSGDGYKLAFKSTDEAALQSKTDTPAWIKTAGSTKATFTERTYNGFKLEDNDKTLRYYKNTTDVNHLTINGLKSSLEAGDNGTIEGVDVDPEKNTITISASALAKSNVTLATTKNYSDYSLELGTTEEEKNALKVKGTGEANDPAITYQTFNNGTASILQGKTEGWTRTSATLITYTKPSVNTLATITGLPKTLEFTEDLATPSNNAIAGITVKNNTITLDKRALEHLTNGKSVTLTNGKDKSGTQSTYTLEIDTSDANKVTLRDETATGTPTFTINKTTAYLRAVIPAGYKTGTDKKGNPIITYYADTLSTTLATITGLPAGCKVVDGKVCLSDGTELLSYGGSGSTVTINNGYFNSNTTAVNLKITGDGAKFTSASDIALFGPNGDNPVTFSKGTMTYKQSNKEGWATVGAAESITGYQYKTAGITNLFTVSGLNTAINTVGTGGGIYVDNNTKTVTVGENALAGKNITLAMPKGTTVGNYYELSIEAAVHSAANDDTKQYWENQVEWVNNGKGTATYKLYDKGNYEVVAASIGGVPKNTTIKYIAPTAGTPYATLTGLTNAASIGNSDIDYTKGVVSLTADDLSTKTVVLKTAADPTTTVSTALTSVTAAKDFKLDFATGDNGVVESTVKSAVWETTGTTAKLVGTVTKGYILSTDKKSVTYQSKDQDGKTIAQITGLRNGAEIKAADVVVDGTDTRISHVRLDAYDLGTTDVALTGAGYALSLGSDVIDYAKTDAWSLKSDWVASNGTFTYKDKYNKASWEKVSDTSIKYHAASAGTNRVAITGLNKDIITAQVDSVIAGVEDAGAIVSIGAGNVITLGEKALNRANIAMSTNADGYTFADFAENDNRKSKASDLTGTVSGMTVTVKAKQSQGYLITNNSQGFTYYANETTPNIAVISGLSADYAASLKGNGADKNLTFDAENNTFTLKNDQLNKEKVVVSGTARFSFAADYGNASIIGSAGVDNIKVAGTGLSINAGNGNDYIDLGTGGNNTFLYAKGQGNDVIANFTKDSDTFKVTKVTSGANLKFLDDNAGDAILKVGSNTVRFKGLASTAFDILDNKGNKVGHTAASGSGDVLADDNFATTPQLSSIVKGSSGYMVTDDLTADATSLTKTDTTIAYSGDKK